MTEWLAAGLHLLKYVAGGVLIGVLIMLPFVAITWWFQRRTQRRWAVHEQVMEMQQQIGEEAMSEEWRDWHRQWRAQQVDIAHEARRRLGLPEEEPGAPGAQP
jgi:hypothetical protein